MGAKINFEGDVEKGCGTLYDENPSIFCIGCKKFKLHKQYLTTNYADFDLNMSCENITKINIKKCPECKKNSLRRVISGGTGLIFKGSGYYLTDYKNKKTQSSENKKSNMKKKDNKTKKKVESWLKHVSK